MSFFGISLFIIERQTKKAHGGAGKELAIMELTALREFEGMVRETIKQSFGLDSLKPEDCSVRKSGSGFPLITLRKEVLPKTINLDHRPELGIFVTSTADEVQIEAEGYKHFQAFWADLLA